ncbi:MAG: hypothetical protein KDA75_03770 [Planctomycetaceae bacterium]|nr:hypothetical protein [Planctomycetaceae bacterium]
MFYRPVQYAGRHFSKTIQYSAIDFQKMSSIVPAFEARLRDWYITPCDLLCTGPDAWHNAFSVCALSCLLIDTLAQFEKNKSGRKSFIDFTKSHFPAFATPLSAPIRRPPPDDAPRDNIVNPAQALYFGFRCGILHEAHIPPYVQMLPEPNIVRTQATGITTYATGDCMSVILDPLRLFAALNIEFQQYIANLLDPDPAHDTLRVNFKAKFTNSFGIDITTAT